MRKPVLSLFLLFLLFLWSGQAVMANPLFVHFELDFFNRGINIFNTETFKRYHQVDLSYYFNDDCKLGFIYNWCDHVNSNISTHKITPWQITLKEDTYRLDALLVNDLINHQQTYSYYVGTYPTYPFGEEHNYSFELKLGIKFASDRITADLGGMIRKGGFWLALNLLSPMDAKLRDESDGKNNIPLTLGYQWHPVATVQLVSSIINFCCLPTPKQTRGRKSV